LFKRLGSVKYITALFLSLLSVLISGCADEAALPQAREIEDPQTPPPSTVDGTQFEFNQVFFGQYGCQKNTELSLLSYDSNMALEQSSCINSETVEGINPLQAAVSSESLILELNTILDDQSDPDVFVFSDRGSLRYADLRNNKIRLIDNFEGRICDIVPSSYFYQELDVALQTKTWHLLDHEYVYVETVQDDLSVSACQNTRANNRYYYKVALNFDALADDFEVCVSEANGKSTDDDCKTRIRSAVTEAEAKSQLIKAWVNDESTADLTDKKLVFGYLGWGREGRGKLKLFDENHALVWEQSRELEAFDSVQIDGAEIASQYLYRLSELEDNFYLLQLGRDHFVFPGEELFARTNSDSILKDRVYLAEKKDDGNGNSIVIESQFSFDDDELVIYDAGKFFRTNYKTAYTAPTSAFTYVMAPDLFISALEANNGAAFSQFEQGDCRFDADETECDNANNLSDLAWQFVTPCELLLGCSVPVDNTDYCVLPSEEVVSTTDDERCNSSRFQDLNELNEPTNDLGFLGFVKHSGDYIRSLDFDFYDNQLLVVVRLLEKDGLLLYDIRQPLSAPKSQREKLLLGERLNQAVMAPIQLNAGVFITTLVQGPEISNRCYKGYEEVQCILNDLSNDGGAGQCTGKDIQLGTCRASKFNYESRALFCTDVQVAGGQCTDDNHVNPATADRQIESADQDAKWVKVLKPSASGIETSVYALVSDAKGPNSVALGQSAVKDEGVLINPELYSVSLPAVSLDQRLGQISGEVETVAEALVVRNGEAKFSVVTQDFFNNGSARKTQGHFVDESAQTVTPVSSFEYILQ
jgi:hypothetical protein